MKRRSRRRHADEPNVPIAPMLDMAFQLLTFFVLTYRPAPIEGQFVMNILPPQAATKMAANANAAENPGNELPSALRTLETTLKAGDGGSLARIMVGENEIPLEPKRLEAELDKYFADPNLPFDQTLLKVDRNLKYSELMLVINAFSNAFARAHKEPKLSFDELRPDEGG